MNILYSDHEINKIIKNTILKIESNRLIQLGKLKIDSKSNLINIKK